MPDGEDENSRIAKEKLNVSVQKDLTWNFQTISLTGMTAIFVVGFA